MGRQSVELRQKNPPFSRIHTAEAKCWHFNMVLAPQNRRHACHRTDVRGGNREPCRRELAGRIGDKLARHENPAAPSLGRTHHTITRGTHRCPAIAPALSFFAFPATTRVAVLGYKPTSKH
ncbi:thiamine-monophosphate kinase [Pseudomonas sp. MT-1]|nr:thiamine-monophosphate kinase [Pseudomonas sp. MT-1]